MCLGLFWFVLVWAVCVSPYLSVACLPACFVCLLACLLACSFLLLVCLLASSFVCLLVCLIAACLFVCLLVCLLACSFQGREDVVGETCNSVIGNSFRRARGLGRPGTLGADTNNSACQRWASDVHELQIILGVYVLSVYVCVCGIMHTYTRDMYMYIHMYI